MAPSLTGMGVVVTTGSPPPSTPNPTRNQGHDDDPQQARDATGSTDRAADTPEIDWERLRYWQAVCADLPPMTEQEIANVALVMRRIDARRAQQRGEMP